MTSLSTTRQRHSEAVLAVEHPDLAVSIHLSVGHPPRSGRGQSGSTARGPVVRGLRRSWRAKYARRAWAAVVAFDDPAVAAPVGCKMRCATCRSAKSSSSATRQRGERGHTLGVRLEPPERGEDDRQTPGQRPLDPGDHVTDGRHDATVTSFDASKGRPSFQRAVRELDDRRWPRIASTSHGMEQQ
jgi:hypothetical protein